MNCVYFNMIYYELDNDNECTMGIMAGINWFLMINCQWASISKSNHLDLRTYIEIFRQIILFLSALIKGKQVRFTWTWAFITISSVCGQTIAWIPTQGWTWVVTLPSPSLFSIPTWLRASCEDAPFSPVAIYWSGHMK